MKLQRQTQWILPASSIADGGARDYQWTPYPRSNHVAYEAKHAHLPRVREALATLSGLKAKIYNNIQCDTRSWDNSSVVEKTVYLHDLQNWLESWPCASDIRKQKEEIPQILIPR